MQLSPASGYSRHWLRGTQPVSGNSFWCTVQAATTLIGRPRYDGYQALMSMHLICQVTVAQVVKAVQA